MANRSGAVDVFTSWKLRRTALAMLESLVRSSAGRAKEFTIIDEPVLSTIVRAMQWPRSMHPSTSIRPSSSSRTAKYRPSRATFTASANLNQFIPHLRARSDAFRSAHHPIFMALLKGALPRLRQALSSGARHSAAAWKRAGAGGGRQGGDGWASSGA